MVEIIITVCAYLSPCKDVKVQVYAENSMVCIYNSQSIVSQWKEANLRLYGENSFILKYKCKA